MIGVSACAVSVRAGPPAFERVITGGSPGFHSVTLPGCPGLAAEPLTTGVSGGAVSVRAGPPAVECLMIGGSPGFQIVTGPERPGLAAESLITGVGGGMNNFAFVTPAGWTLPQATAGLAAPARAKASAPPETTTTRFLVICRSHSQISAP